MPAWRRIVDYPSTDSASHFWFANPSVDDNLHAETEPVITVDYLAPAISWINVGFITWFAAATLGGLLILLAERFDSRREPSDADVKRAASRYRQHYRAHALNALGDHMMAASFAPDSRHKRFLKRVYAEIVAGEVTDDDRARAIEP